jgi:hypothetical protein
MDDREERIRSRAYELWEREGRPDGRQAEHWRQATAEVDAEERERAGGSGATGAPPSGVSSSLQQSGTAPGGGPGASQGSVGTGGGSAGSTGNVEKSPKSGYSS